MHRFRSFGPFQSGHHIMKPTASSQFACLLTALCLAGTAAAAAAAAGNGMPPGVKMRDQGTLAAIGDNLKLQKTVTGLGNGLGASLPQFAFTTIDERTVTCAVAAGCAIGMEAMAQMKPQGADWAICLYIDGLSVSCQYQGIQGSTTGYVVGNARGMGTVAQGNHTVTTQLYTEAATSTYAYFQTDYRIYK
jgi:hypothetical protein